MGSLPAKHVSKSKVRRRRSQLYLKKLPVLPCAKCKAPTLAHRLCAHCGFFPKKAKKSVNVLG